MKRKPKIAIFSLTSCEGCQFVLLDLGEKFFKFLEKVELAQCSLLEEEPLRCDLFDIAFVEGNPITKKDFKTLKEVREKAKILVSLGNCATLGGIPEMKNYQSKERTIRFIYKEINNIDNPEIKEIDNFVKVDYSIPGCPINGEEFLRIANELIKGKIPKIPQKPVCSECPLSGTKDCLLRKKEPCLGPITLAGCDAICPKSSVICYGCRGILNNINPKNFIKFLNKMRSQEEIEENIEIFGIKDDIKKFL